ncbi:MAG TPA: hypothetical protein VGJ72_05670 [Polaromonas sp.]|jgi:hypothetical protein
MRNLKRLAQMSTVELSNEPLAPRPFVDVSVPGFTAASLHAGAGNTVIKEKLSRSRHA